MSDKTNPRPWRIVDVAGGDRMIEDAGGWRFFRYSMAPDTPEMVVRAVNHHDELVAMVERLADTADEMDQTPDFGPINAAVAAARDLLKRVRGG